MGPRPNGRRWVPVVVGGVVAAAVIGGVSVCGSGTETATETATGAEAATEAATASETETKAATDTETEAETEAATDTEAASATGVQTLSESDREALGRKIHGRFVEESRRARAGEPSRTLDARYIQDAVREIRPLLRECYESVVAQGWRETVRLDVELSISADPEIGGVVESSEIEQMSVENAELRQCVRETLYTLRFAEPERRGRATTRMPIVFTPGPP